MKTTTHDNRPYTPPKLTPPKFDILPQPPVKFGQLGTILNKLRNGK